MAAGNKSMDLAGGALLLAATIAALVMANSPLSGVYDLLLSTRIDFRIAPQNGIPAFEIAKPLALWINDGLMVIFFLLVGLEIKRELVQGGLSSPRRAALPVIGAVGGILGPSPRSDARVRARLARRRYRWRSGSANRAGFRHR